MYSQTSKLLLAVATTLVFASVAVAQVMPTAPDYSYLFDGDATAATGGQDGTPIGNGVSFDADTPFAYGGNQSLLLDGTDDQVDVTGLSTGLNGLSNMTISMWIRADSEPSDRPFLALSPPSNGDNGGMRFDDEGANAGGNDVFKLSFGVDNNNFAYESAENLQSTNWTHVLMSWEDGVGMKFYVDGVLDTPTDDPFPTTGMITDQTEFLIGNGPKGHTGDSWDGRIDEVAVWESALSDSEVLWLSQNSINDIQAVPEPGSIVLACLGAAGLCGLLVWRRRSA